MCEKICPPPSLLVKENELGIHFHKCHPSKRKQSFTFVEMRFQWAQAPLLITTKDQKPSKKIVKIML